MAWVATAIVGGSVVSGYLSGQAQSDAASDAAGAQMEVAKLQTEESRRQFDAIRALLAPYMKAGEGALGGQLDLLGLNGGDAQRAAINGISSGPQMAALQKQGETSILANASATGGLRGGNTQAALAQFRPQLLNQLIQQRFSDLGGITSVGQNAAAGVGNAGMNSSNQVINALGQSGAAQAGAYLAQGQATANMWNTVGQTGTTLGMLKLLGKF